MKTPIIPLQQAPVYSASVHLLGTVELWPMDLQRDTPEIYQWVTQPYAHYWGMTTKSYEAVLAEYTTIHSSDHAGAWIGKINGKAVFLCECYDPAHDLIGNFYKPQPGDVGMHILVGPPETPVHGFTWQVFSIVMNFLFDNPLHNRVVVEPDVRNEKIHRINKRAGFIYEREVQLPHKTAALAFCTRKQYLTAKKQLNMNTNETIMNAPEQVIAHLQPDIWARANRLHVTKIISEFAHELLLQPEWISDDQEWAQYRLAAPGTAQITYFFRARILSLNHWSVDADSIRKVSNGQNMPLDNILLIQEFQSQLNISTENLPAYLEEITSTLNGSAYMMSRPQLPMSALAQADYQVFEHAMTSGHPCFVANNGRIGFDANDYGKYAPEADLPMQLVWLAGHKSRTAYSAVDELPYSKLIADELGEEVLAAFNKKLTDKGLSPDDYFFIPIHPWQWYNKLAIICAPDLANQHLVCLGYSPDLFNAQQSIRTFYNLSHPEKHYTKTALSILNMGFVRGLTPYYMDSTPPITEWIRKYIGEDPYLKQNGFTSLCEVATVGYRNFYYEPFGKQVAYNKMLAGLWRESPAKVLQPGQQLMTMAALLHIDYDGNALLPALVAASGISLHNWLERYLQAYLIPLLHCFYEHDLVFMPHGENLILVLENQVPVKAIMKDITEEIGVFRMNTDIAEKGRRICVTVPEELRILSILTDVFDCFFRFLSNILVTKCDYREEDFWQQVAACVYAYQDDQPQHAAKFEQYDMFAPEFILSCLNRLQLRNNRQMVDLADPAGSLQLAGMLQNPIAPFKRTTAAPAGLENIVSQ